MIKAAAEEGWLDHDKTMIDNYVLGQSKRTTYFAKKQQYF
jgi:delta-aminolevulinic acid dehydratase/porphobilinogen synthase